MEQSYFGITRSSCTGHQLWISQDLFKHFPVMRPRRKWVPYQQEHSGNSGRFVHRRVRLYAWGSKKSVISNAHMNTCAFWVVSNEEKSALKREWASNRSTIGYFFGVLFAWLLWKLDTRIHSLSSNMNETVSTYIFSFLSLENFIFIHMSISSNPQFKSR